MIYGEPIKLYYKPARKRCSSCKLEKCLSDYNRDKYSSDQLQNKCRDCQKKYFKKWKNKETQSQDTKIFPILPFDMNNKDWQVGKLPGGVRKLHNRNSWQVRLSGKGKSYSKSFNWSKYGGKEKALQKAVEWWWKIADENNLIKNRIKLVDVKTIKIQLTRNKTMVTDMDFLNLCQTYVIGVNKITDDYYSAVINIDRDKIPFHDYITGYEMVDHKDRNPLNNRLSNLQITNHIKNSINCNKHKHNTSGYSGVYYITSQNVWKVKIRAHKTNYEKSFSVNKYGDEKAKQLAIEYRLKLAYETGNTNGLDPFTLTFQ